MGSRSDQFFKRRKAKKRKEIEYKANAIPTLTRVLVICEGEQTEPNYFNSLKSEYKLNTVVVEGCKKSGSSPKSIVEFGKRKLIREPDFDMIFFVFDKDTHSSFDDALNIIDGLNKKRIFTKKKFYAITSNPCFEVWFVMHFELFTKPFSPGSRKSPCEQVIQHLKKYPDFKEYSKGKMGYFELLHDKLDRAKVNANKSLKLSYQQGDRKHHGNPTTYVHKLVIALEKLIEEQRIQEIQKFQQ